MPEPDEEFDEIVQGLDLDLSFPDDPPPATPPHRAADDLARAARRGEPFYRKVTPPPHRPLHRGRAAAWIAVLGSPVAIMVFSILHIWLSRPVLLGIGLIFVAGSV